MIAICPNPFRDAELKITRQAVKLLNDAGFDTAVCPVFAEGNDSVIPENIATMPLRDVAPDCSLIVVIGGDGTILAVSRQIKGSEVPLLGVNLGTKGFMTTLEPENIGLIVKAAKGDYRISKRMMLDVSLIRDGKAIYTDYALNDAVVHGYGDCVKISAWCDGERITGFSGDGVIISTATGSTGYSMSAGGPIVEPEAKNFIVSPICAHVMGAKTFVLGPDRKVTVKAEKIHDRRAYVAVDGAKGIDLANDDIVTVRQSRKVANLVHMGLSSFYDSTFDKLLYKNR